MISKYSTLPERRRPMAPTVFPARSLIFGAAFLICVALAAFTAQAAPPEPVAAAAPAASSLTHVAPTAFELLSPDDGWLWLGADLYWTADGGDTWRAITPVPTAQASLAAVHFLDAYTGWAVLQPAAAPAALTLAVTHDAGHTWETHALALTPASAMLHPGTISLAMVDAQTGWLAIKRSTSSNFSAGWLWQTVDGGATWLPRNLPFGDPVQFADGQRGWVAGGVSGEELWRTGDGGATWVPQAIQLPDATTALRRTVYAPIWAADRQSGVMPVLLHAQTGQTVVWYATQDGGETWQAIHAFAPAQVETGQALPDLDPRAWLVEQTGTQVLPPSQALPFFANRAVGAGEHIAQLKMATTTTGWALAEPSSLLLRTNDGGQRWQTLRLPVVARAQEQATVPHADPDGTIVPPAIGERTVVASGAGFDSCNLPGLAELQTWLTASPYRIVNLYIGGVLRGCRNEALTASTVGQLAAQGWKFIPTWVGPQAPCSEFRVRFSSDPASAFAQGAAEADAAVTAAQALGLTQTDGSGTIIYYDLEGFDADAACLAAAQSFVAGWTDRMHALNNQAGLYGSACNPRLERFANFDPALDAIWVAQWNRDAYDPEMGVFGVACLSDSLWTRSQRIRQYAGGHDETWGGVTLNIDSNVLDSLVADPLKPPSSVTVEAADLMPAYSNGMCGSGWYQLINDRGFPTYLAANRDRNGTIPPPVAHVARWQPPIPADGFYRVEAYIAAHDPVAWRCPDGLIPNDTSSARYTIEHSQGSTLKQADQASYSNSWLLLGVYPFAEGTSGAVSLSDMTNERDYTRTVSAGALRFTRVPYEGIATDFLYLPAASR